MEGAEPDGGEAPDGDAAGQNRGTPFGKYRSMAPRLAQGVESVSTYGLFPKLTHAAWCLPRLVRAPACTLGNTLDAHAAVSRETLTPKAMVVEPPAQ